ncbi:uncharacterized protein DUF4129 [Sediminihabitans luteus]|uniref:Uncharacterized protein DUF4129 n=1 Tax=Sediminihabitans luteus TaxID=1138585 RepID=A0A2M9CQV3_9CELL|nr:DUF4129 domain-containing protein [Sediminihabitans luteus]PJJ74267.1 uncharacterized protein DUF4129 [Sediminihabitans luteus]GII99120.1 hypothetical protein Slu03_14980 [Sediminihabitans luteus]
MSRTRLAAWVGALVATVVLAAALAPAWSVNAWISDLGVFDGPAPELTPPAATPVPTPTPTRLLEEAGDSTLTRTLVKIVFAGIALLVAAVIVSWFRGVSLRRTSTIRMRATDAGGTGEALDADPDDLTPAPLRRGVRTATDRLESAATPTDGVVAAWVALEESAADLGAHRDPAQTPTEFTTKVLHRTQADPHAVTTLRDLYLQARFGDHPLDPIAVTTARTALERLTETLTPEARDTKARDIETPGTTTSTPGAP